MLHSAISSNVEGQNSTENTTTGSEVMSLTLSRLNGSSIAFSEESPVVLSFKLKQVNQKKALKKKKEKKKIQINILYQKMILSKFVIFVVMRLKSVHQIRHPFKQLYTLRSWQSIQKRGQILISFLMFYFQNKLSDYEAKCCFWKYTNE